MGDVREDLRDRHPRIFFSPDDFASLRGEARQDGRNRIGGADPELLQAIESQVEALADRDREIDDRGKAAAEAAFLYRIREEPRYRDLAIDLLADSIDYYHQCFEHERPVAWVAWSRVHALCAYDWLYPDLSADEQIELGSGLLEAVENVQPTAARESFTGENWGDTTSGFYGTPCLTWYAGLAMDGAGVNDELAARFLRRGYEANLEMLAHRAELAGDDGTPITQTIHYALQRYPYAEFNFFNTMRSATGRTIAKEWPHLLGLPEYIRWNWLPGGRHFGVGDDFHEQNRLPDQHLHMHLAQLGHFYGESAPGAIALAKWLRDRLPEEFDPTTVPFRLTRFLHDDPFGGIDPAGPPDDLPMARHFSELGQTFVRSGDGPTDTYAQFTAGGRTTQHRHYDATNFTIYRDGYLALDSGTRPQPGGAGTASDHLAAYYPRTVAHNCVTIRMTGEEFQPYWGHAPEGGVPNDGGQRKQTGSSVLAFETTPAYSYVAGDATEVYHEDKCERALRQFVFVPPEHFVVFDRLQTVEPCHEKRWLLHTAAEPEIDGRRFATTHEDGRLVGQTLLPEATTVEKRGGPGEQFWSDGRNWPLPEGYHLPDSHPLFGQWRIETRPDADHREVRFLHLLRAVDDDRDMPDPGALISTEKRRGVRFRADESEWKVTFDVSGAAGGRVREHKDGTVVRDATLAETVEQQSRRFGLE